MYIDLLDWEATQFELDLDEVIVPIHEAAILKVHEIHADRELVAQEHIREADMAEDEAESQFERDLAKEEEKRAKERERIVGWLLLVYLVSLLHCKLNTLCEVLDAIARERGIQAQALDKRHRRTKKGWLGKISDKYRSFGVDLQSNSAFRSIQELVLARNDVEHNNGKPGTGYLEMFPNPRFVVDGTIVFSNHDFKESLELLKRYVEWLVCELKHLRDGQKPLGPLQRPRPSVHF